MDLIFDSQAFRHRRADELPERVIASIAGYYHRATTTSRPMSLLIALVMVILLAALGFHALRGDEPCWLVVASTVLAGVPIVLAMVRTVPNAVRLGNRIGTSAEQSRLARSIGRDHLFCMASMSAFLAVWLSAAW
jgi:hypothetical protein